MGEDRAGSRDTDLGRLEQIHVALGSTARLEDFYLILASLLVDPNTFGFSRAFLFRYDERLRCYSGRIALGANSRKEHEQFRRELEEENRLLREQVEQIQRESPEPAAVQPLYDLRFHSLWIQLLQGQNSESSLISSFHDAVIRRDGLPEGHLLEQAARATHAALVPEGGAQITGLEKIVCLPCIAGRLMTRRGLHGILVADRAYDTEPIGDEARYEFQQLLNHASVSLENVVLVEELTRTTERLREVDRLKSNFLSIVSHELRTPLTSIVGFVHLLSHDTVGPLTAAQRDLLRRITQHSSHLQSMVGDLLEIAEVEAGGMLDLDLEPVDPLKALYAVTAKVEARHAERKPAIEPVMTGAVPSVLAEESALERIYLHLLDNAVKFSRETPARVRVEFGVGTDGSVSVSIIDRGIGISQEHLKRIFDHFFQVDFRLDRAFGGMGIGLTVVKALADAIGGRITVESTPGVGSRFTLTLPVAPTDAGI